MYLCGDVKVVNLMKSSSNLGKMYINYIPGNGPLGA